VQLVDMVIKDGTDIYQHTTSAESGIRKLQGGSNMTGTDFFS